MSRDYVLPKPTLILGVGISGSGKSTFLKALAKRIDNPVYLSKDTINYPFLRKRVNPGPFSDVGLHLLEGEEFEDIPRSSDFYRDCVLLQSYRVLLDLAKENLELGLNPIIEGNYVKELMAGYMENVIWKIFDPNLFKIKIILTHAPEEIIRERQIKRRMPHDPERSEEGWKDFFSKQPVIPEVIDKYSHIKVDTSKEITEDIIDRVIFYLQN